MRRVWELKSGGLDDRLDNVGEGKGRIKGGGGEN